MCLLVAVVCQSIPVVLLSPVVPRKEGRRTSVQEQMLVLTSAQSRRARCTVLSTLGVLRDAPAVTAELDFRPSFAALAPHFSSLISPRRNAGFEALGLELCRT
jgi:hypothetical protein